MKAPQTLQLPWWRSRRRSTVLILFLSAAAFTVSFGSVALATQTQLALDLDFAHPLAESAVDSGGGGVLRLGQQLDLAAITVTGELGLGYHTFGGVEGPRDYAAMAGGRLAIGKVLEPGAFIHIGASRLVDEFEASWSPEMDMGLFLELTIFPLVDLGVHGTYVHRFATTDTGSFKYLMVGPHVALLF
jgi:hypothetical protein